MASFSHCKLTVGEIKSGLRYLGTSWAPTANRTNAGTSASEDRFKGFEQCLEAIEGSVTQARRSRNRYLRSRKYTPEGR